MKAEFQDIDCSTFTQVREISALKPAEASDGLRHELEFHSHDGMSYAGPAPHMIQTNICGFLQREYAIAEARKNGYRWRS